MAEARAEEDEERLREPGGARRNAEHSDRNKPDQRHSSQGPLSSIRAVIKRTSARTSSQSDHQRDRSRRPEITILSAEPLPSNTWFPGASGAFPPAPPPAPPTWAAGSATVQLPPPSYEQVIREKSREQNLHSSSSSSSPTSRHSTSTIATQTDTNSSGPQSSAARPVRRPPKPQRPSLPLKHTHEVDRSNANAGAQPRDALREQCGVQTDFDDIFDDISPIGPAPTAITFTQINLDSPGDPMKEEPSVRPRPRPRSRVALRPNEDVLDLPMTREVKVQTLVRLKDDGAENVFAGFDDAPSNISSKYLQDLLEVFGSDETHVQHGESQQSNARTVEEEENMAICDAPCAVITPEPVEPLNRPQPRPRTQKSRPQLAPKPSVFEVFDTSEPTVEQNPSKPLSPPVPAPRPLLNKLQSPSESRSSPSAKPSPAARPNSAPPGQQMAAVASMPSERRNSDDQTTNTPVKTAPVMLTDRNVGKRPSAPKHSRPPPPVLRKTPSTSQAAVDVSRAPDASIPSLPPRPSGGRLLPLRPPPIKVTKLPGSSSSPAATNQLPGNRVPKRGPPLPPRPKPGHPLYKRYSSKVQRDAELENISKEQEEPPEETSLHEEEHLIVLDDIDVPKTPSNPLHDLCSPGEVKGQDVTVSELLLDDEPSEQQIQQNTQNRCVVARFAFEGEEGELSFAEGDVITLIEYVNEEWGRGLLNGQTGIFPLSFIQAIEETEALPRKPALESPAPPAGARTTGRALYDFTPECEDELCLKEGDVVCDLEDMDAEWFLGESGGKRGIVPKNYIQVLLDP
ncbi:SH3 domain-containing protein 19 [Onychostoma macrolepis]|uniref:SH3 domain-containing protein n=1 Tax=Onychostoma macrolepis TaxID=369639 RepID=A0A7J6BMI1_9TELE|nr:SH3 domain-containing protein 19 [Onychostoma macrolepis]KAF4096240.1 hypothetical protein G5714_022209 [Onychostoma macrolepis]